MAACTNFQLTVYVWRLVESETRPPVHLETLIFPDLRVDNNGRITGEVFIGSTKLADVAGSCRPIQRPDGKLLTLEFNWGPRDLFLTGFTYPAPSSSVILFRGRFIALPHQGALLDTFNPILGALTIPEEGETGTGTGQQT
jgi:hypothetical protein